jgi:peroxiredoxin
LADFAAHTVDYTKEQVRLIAFSADDREHAREVQEKHDIAFALGYGVDAEAFARATGCYYDPDDHYLHASGYIVRPDGTIASAVYATGAVGRLRAEEALEQAKFFRSD